jgi:hypothetical protein
MNQLGGLIQRSTGTVVHAVSVLQVYSCCKANSLNQRMSTESAVGPIVNPFDHR